MQSEANTNGDLGTEVFGRIAQHWATLTDKIAAIVQTRYSFEEWLNWEALVAFLNLPDWTVRPRPRYRDKDRVEYGDLLATNLRAGTSVFIETKLIHDGTGEKWYVAMDHDMTKLLRSTPEGMIPLQIVVVASKAGIEDSAEWQRLLGMRRSWARATRLSTVVRLPPDGQMIVRGWCGRP